MAFSTLFTDSVQILQLPINMYVKPGFSGYKSSFSFLKMTVAALAVAPFTEKRLWGCDGMYKASLGVVIHRSSSAVNQENFSDAPSLCSSTAAGFICQLTAVFFWLECVVEACKLVTPLIM